MCVCGAVLCRVRGLRLQSERAEWRDQAERSEPFRFLRADRATKAIATNATRARATPAQQTQQLTTHSYGSGRQRLKGVIVQVASEEDFASRVTDQAAQIVPLAKLA